MATYPADGVKNAEIETYRDLLGLAPLVCGARAVEMGKKLTGERS